MPFHDRRREKQNVTSNNENLKKWLKINVSIVHKKSKCYVYEKKAINIKVNINKERAIFINLKIWEIQTIWLKLQILFNQKRTVYEKKNISYHHDAFRAGESAK